jgi:hypothetical protein
MKYLLMIYQDEHRWKELSEAEVKQIYEEFGKLRAQLQSNGSYLGGSQLQPTITATSVRIRDGKELVTDGPFAETHEQLGGYLLIDVKTDAEATYAALDQVLARYADILSVTRDGKMERKAVTVILSGNRATDVIAKQSVRYVGIDGRPENLDSQSPAELFPWISANWTLLFKWNGEGPMAAAERQKLNDVVKRAHEQGRKIRFWATAEKEAMWKELLAAGVDYINTDKLDELQKFLQAQ